MGRNMRRTAADSYTVCSWHRGRRTPFERLAVVALRCWARRLLASRATECHTRLALSWELVQGAVASVSPVPSKTRCYRLLECPQGWPQFVGQAQHRMLSGARVRSEVGDGVSRFSSVAHQERKSPSGGRVYSTSLRQPPRRQLAKAGSYRSETCRSIRKAGSDKQRRKVQRWRDNPRSSWCWPSGVTCCLCIYYLFSSETEFSKSFSDTIATVRARHTSCRRRSPMPANPRHWRVVTATMCCLVRALPTRSLSRRQRARSSLLAVVPPWRAALTC